jgi:hypothetical protein
MTSIDYLPITATPDLDPSQVNIIHTPTATQVTAYYSPYSATWLMFDHQDATYYKVYGIDAPDWPEVWNEIISKEQAG